MTTTPQVNEAELRWLLTQARDFYEYSKSKRTPGARETNRKKFVATVRQLLPLASVETITAWVRGPRRNKDTDDAQVIIENLARGPSPGVPSAIDLPAANRLLADGLSKIADAVRLLNPGLQNGA